MGLNKKLYTFENLTTKFTPTQYSSDKNHCINYFKNLQSTSQLQLSSSTAP